MYFIKVSGINCGRCVSNITKALADLDKTAKVQVDKTTQTVTFDGTEDIEAVVTAIKEEGYGVMEAVSG